MAAQTAALEGFLEAAMRSLSERSELCRQMAGQAFDTEDLVAAAQWEAAMREAKERATVLSELLEREGVQPDTTEALQPSGG